MHRAGQGQVEGNCGCAKRVAWSRDPVLAHQVVEPRLVAVRSTWLWTSVGDDAVCFHIDPSRSAEAARTLFGGLRAGTVIVCDRYSAYKKLARLLGGMVVLQFCWSHMRRDFIQCAAGQVDLARWCEAWLERIAAIYRLNEARLDCHSPGMERQSDAFDAAQGALEAALDDMFARAGRELAGLPDDAREAKALRSLANHREGLSVFVDRPRTPMDNNLAYADIGILPRKTSSARWR
ncbi:MAG: transposase [Rhodospirillaceae bacterium]|nr:transposase [Rhodospirillaceae bacterium]